MQKRCVSGSESWTSTNAVFPGPTVGHLIYGTTRPTVGRVVWRSTRPTVGRVVAQSRCPTVGPGDTAILDVRLSGLETH